MSADRETLDVYNASVADYEKVGFSDTAAAVTRDFIARLPEGAHVLDVGCGPGSAAAEMMAAGHTVDAFDASGEMVRAAVAKGVPARVAVFDDPVDKAAYDAVWCSFSLLHAPREAMPGYLAAYRAALRDGGLLLVGLKLGAGRTRDRMGRIYTYYGEEELVGLIEEAGFQVIDRTRGRDAGLSGEVSDWIVVTARA